MYTLVDSDVGASKRTTPAFAGLLHLEDFRHRGLSSTERRSGGTKDSILEGIELVVPFPSLDPAFFRKAKSSLELLYLHRGF